jgi:hypothetical protein
MLNPLLTKAYDASGAVGAYLCVKFAAADGVVSVATAGADKVIGVSTSLAAADGERVDVIRTGIAEVIYGGNVTRGDLLMAGAGGKAVLLVPGAGVRCLGVAEVSGVANDVGSVLLSPAGVNA